MEATNKAVAVRFIEAFNTDGWDTVREVVSSNYVFHHPVGGTVQAGAEGMVQAWSGFKASSPDSWHPIPVMVAEGDYVAVLLPTYGNFAGEPYHGIPPTGGWLEYGMVNMVRFENGKLVEMWFGMDSLTELQQMGAIPSPPPRKLSEAETANLELFRRSISQDKVEFDNLTVFGNTVAAFSPPQSSKDTRARRLEIYQVANGSLTLVHSHEFTTNPPYGGDPSTDTEVSRAVVRRFFEEVLRGHDLDVLGKLLSSNILIHPTAMPCEAGHYGTKGIRTWLEEQWSAFPDLTITDYFMIAEHNIVAVRWSAQGTSKGTFLMLPPTGKKVSYTGVSMYRADDGKIAEIWETRNTLAIMKQLNPKIGADH